ncbi:tRNA lysidine(34) synthetase TilS [Pseudaestuariivita sp.]|uniref:tRNA lysidine(34) synthetase TilS n=1 Tax=Pseudaestuariivita sp. TaxID=2211669 RepID=UPI004057DAFF
MGQLLGPDFPTDVALAVSGGSDSMAMLLLAHGWARHMGVRLWIVTVDHGLRDGSAAEAAFVKRECAALGLSHTTLRWGGWDGSGNLQARAREARYGLIDRWRGLLTHVLVAHTRDDVAETFLMRLARGSGVDGLSAMQDVRRVWSGPSEPLGADEVDGPRPPQWEPRNGTRVRPGWMDVVRPLLSERRDTLRAHLRFYHTPWVEDPSNDDPAFDRVALRRAMPELARLGMDVETLAATAERMARARAALETRAFEAAREVEICGTTGDVILSRDHLTALDGETALRLLAEALRYVSSHPLRPRASLLEDVLDRAASGGALSGHGCLITTTRDSLRVTRELAAVESLTVQVGDGLWDSRWRISGQLVQGLTIQALGDAGTRQLPHRPEGILYKSLVAMPALFDGKALAAFAPAAFGPPYTAHLQPPGGAFAAAWAPLKRRR